MKYLTVFRVVFGCAAKRRMIATVSSSAGDHAIPDGTTENDAKYRAIFHFIDTPPCAKKEKPKYHEVYNEETQLRWWGYVRKTSAATWKIIQKKQSPFAFSDLTWQLKELRRLSKQPMAAKHRIQNSIQTFFLQNYLLLTTSFWTYCLLSTSAHRLVVDFVGATWTKRILTIGGREKPT